MNRAPRATTPGDAIRAMTARLAAVDRAREPVLWATAAYRLGMATAEQPSANPAHNLRLALDLYRQAGDILTAKRAPVEHARILNAAGSARRMLGEPANAIELFADALELMTGRAAVTEQASVLNNLGLVLSETGQINDAIEAFDRSLQILPGETHEQIRTALATKHNLGHLHLARGGADGCDAAIEVLQQASVEALTIDAPMHSAMIDHSLGVAWKTRASLYPSGLDDTETAAALAHAIDCFEQSLRIFTSVGFPMQHAIAKHNLGHALAARNDLASLQRALVCYDDALNIFDPRLHLAQWEEAFKNAEAVEARLELVIPGASRADHTASFVGAMDESERLVFLRQRLAQMERLPEARRVERLTQFACAVVAQPAASFVATLRTMITVLMELPEPLLESALRAQLGAHRQLDPHDQRAADFVLDETIDALLFGPQRIRVRDMLEQIGWDRP